MSTMQASVTYPKIQGWLRIKRKFRGSLVWWYIMIPCI